MALNEKVTFEYRVPEKDSYGYSTTRTLQLTPLAWAAYLGRTDIMKALLKAGAYFNAHESQALHQAVARKQKESVQVLLMLALTVTKYKPQIQRGNSRNAHFKRDVRR